MDYKKVAPSVTLGQKVYLADFINLYGCRIGDGTRLGAFVEVQKNATIGKNCKISSHTFICEGVTIEDDVFVGHSVVFINDTYPRATTDGILQLLGDLGADIIKVEPPDGDILRHIAPMRHPAMGHIFLHHNRNKRSIVLDLEQPAGREALLRLARGADVLIYNVRPQAMKRLKLAYEDVAAVNPRIIYVGAYGYSQRGRYAAQPAYDDLNQGMAGPPWATHVAGADRPRYNPTAISDHITGLAAVNAVTAALYYRERTAAQFVYSTAIVVLMLFSLALPENPMNLCSLPSFCISF